MKIKDVMTRHPAVTALSETIQEAARKMKQNDCGMIPVMDGDRCCGTITDRDIAINAVAAGQAPGTSVKDVFSRGLVSCRESDDVRTATQRMKDAKVRRIVVTDDNERPVGVVSLADLALRNAPDLDGLVDEVSEPK